MIYFYANLTKHIPKAHHNLQKSKNINVFKNYEILPYKKLIILIISYDIIVNNEAIGKVKIQDIKILRITVRFKAPIPRAKPTPKTAPTRVCVADTGIPVLV